MCRRSSLILRLGLLLVAGGAVQAESLLYAVQNNNGTSVFRYSTNGEKQQLFSDHLTSTAIYKLKNHRRLVTAKGRVFAYGKPRKPGKADYYPPTHPSFRRENHRTYIYELSLDGSNAARKIGEVLGTQSPRRFLVSPDASHIAYLNLEWWQDKQNKHQEATYIYIHDTTTGKLKYKIDCGLRKYAGFSGVTWLDNHHIYIWRMPVIDDHLAEDQDTSNPIGPHVIDTRSRKTVALKNDPMMLMLDQGLRQQEESVPLCDSAMNNNNLLCQSPAFGHRRDEKCSYASKMNLFVYDTKKSKAQNIFQSGYGCKRGWRLSPLQGYLASISHYHGLHEMHIWLHELKKGTVRAVTKIQSPPDTLYIVGWE